MQISFYIITVLFIIQIGSSSNNVEKLIGFMTNILNFFFAAGRSEPTFRLPFVVKALPQMEQAKGFSPVCVRSWICRALAEEKFFPQDWQVCCLGVRRGGGGANIGLRLGLIVV